MSIRKGKTRASNQDTSKVHNCCSPLPVTDKYRCTASIELHTIRLEPLRLQIIFPSTRTAEARTRDLQLTITIETFIQLSKKVVEVFQKKQQLQFCTWLYSTLGQVRLYNPPSLRGAEGGQVQHFHSLAWTWYECISMLSTGCLDPQRTLTIYHTEMTRKHSRWEGGGGVWFG